MKERSAVVRLEDKRKGERGRGEETHSSDILVEENFLSVVESQEDFLSSCPRLT